MPRKQLILALACALATTQASAEEVHPVQNPQTADQAIDIDPAIMLGKLEAWVVGFQKLLPNIVVAIVVFVVFVRRRLTDPKGARRLGDAG